MQPEDSFAASLQQWVEVSMRHSMHDFVRFARQAGLSMPQIGALFHISHKGSSVSDLGEHLGVSNAAASQMLERLVQQGFISRLEDPNDRRFKQLTLTAKGRQVLQAAIRARQDWLFELAAMLTEAEQQQVGAALELLTEKAQQLERLPRES